MTRIACSRRIEAICEWSATHAEDVGDVEFVVRWVMVGSFRKCTGRPGRPMHMGSGSELVAVRDLETLSDSC